MLQLVLKPVGLNHCLAISIEVARMIHTGTIGKLEDPLTSNIGKVRDPHIVNMSKVMDLKGKVIEGWMM